LSRLKTDNSRWLAEILVSGWLLYALPDLGKTLPHVRVIKGGILQLLGNQEVMIRGMALAPGDAYACISE